MPPVGHWDDARKLWVCGRRKEGNNRGQFSGEEPAPVSSFVPHSPTCKSLASSQWPIGGPKNGQLLSYISPCPWCLFSPLAWLWHVPLQSLAHLLTLSFHLIVTPFPPLDFSRFHLVWWIPIFPADFHMWLTRYPDDGGSAHIWDVGPPSWDYTALHHRELSPSTARSYDESDLLAAMLQTSWWLLYRLDCILQN